ncbi:hypothetical protein AKJ64_03620 [candidate division MSBL1 archaeon SCGC-AAA259E17]|uniref:N-sulphoglucosamine sulphohydrolase C-terminal domain-containing protein n=1 Tax=candidate division MSBL1 archaeon SCGC-AAA259E17 TaxID=1698263 RepID=A0A133UDM6_9EURY|nr:hypothetical protein AKJ64_03620 [candidate division MSBL1 archaeon SCGC-AAA259E17]
MDGVRSTSYHPLVSHQKNARGNYTISLWISFTCVVIFPRDYRHRGEKKHVDIAPTILDLMNIDDHPLLDGQSLLSLNGASDDKEKIIVETNGQRAILEDKMKYIWHHQGEPKWNPGTEDELYDVRSDPMEINNIRDERKDKANEMRNDLKEWVEKQLEGKIDPLKYCGRGAGLTPVIEQKSKSKGNKRGRSGGESGRVGAPVWGLGERLLHRQGGNKGNAGGFRREGEGDNIIRSHRGGVRSGIPS